MKKKTFSILATLLFVVQGVWAQSYDYFERSWDETSKQVKTVVKTCTNYNVINGSSNDEWLPLTNGWWVVTENSKYKSLVIQGDDVRLLIPDMKTLTLTGGVRLMSGNKLTIYSQGGDVGQLIVTNEYSEAAGIGSAKVDGSAKAAGELVIHGGIIHATGGRLGAGIGSGAKNSNDSKLCNTVTVYGGTVTAIGGEDGAGIGGGAGLGDFGNHGGTLIVYGGTVTAQGGDEAAGVGGGGGYSAVVISSSEYGGQGGTVRVYGGTLNATGGNKGAGIGSGERVARGTYEGGTIEVYGGTVNAQGGDSGAGIGGGCHAGGGVLKVYGGTVNATGGKYGAGIGGGEDSRGGTFEVYGGMVTAKGAPGAAGIGGGDGSIGYAGYNSILGGTVIAEAGTQGGTKNRAIGPGDNIEWEKNRFFSLDLGDEMMVSAGNTGSTGLWKFTNAERVDACKYRSYARIEPCTHSDATYTVSGTSPTDTHTAHCNHCATAFTAKTHTFDNDGKCTVCGVQTTTYTVTVNVPANNGATDGVYEAVSYKMVPGTKFILPASPITFNDRVFAGWLVGEAKNSSYRTSYYEELLAAGEEYTINGDVTFTARYSYVYITLYDDADNSEMLSKYTGMTATVVTLKDRTLYKDGSWNTLCLPFSLSSLTGTPLEGATVKTLESSAFNETDGTLTLNFSDASKIEAGKPYLVKWASTGGTNLTVIQFGNVTISNTNQPVETEVVTFTGSYSPYAISGEDKTILYIDADNKLCYPNAAMTIGACRAYFQLADGLTAGESSSASAKSISHIVLNFDNGVVTGITNTDFTDGTDETGAWYDLSGRRLTSKPTQKGIYINNGIKVVIK